MILAYHKVAPVAETNWWITVDRFFEQMAALRSREVVFLDDYDPTNDKHVVITFDGVYENIYRYAFPILTHFNYPFELFVIGDYVGRENTFDQHIEPSCYFADENMLREMCSKGGRVQWHTRNHKRFTLLSQDEVAAELSPPASFSSLFRGANLQWFAYPHGDCNLEHRRVVEGRFKGALACDDGDATDIFNLPRKLVFENTSLFRGSVAAIIANYNYGHLLREAVDSLERQSSRPDEILIIDDASSDGSELVLQELEMKGYRVVRNEHNLGIIDNFNKAVGLTHSDFIFFLGADNRLRSDYVLECRTVLDGCKNLAVAYSDMTIFGPLAGKLAQSVGAELVGRKQGNHECVYLWRFPEPSDDAVREFSTKNFVHGSSMYRRSFFEKVGGYKKSYGPEDHNLFLRMWQAGGGLKRVALPLLEYRQHSPAQANSLLSLSLEAKALRDIVTTGAMPAEVRGYFEELALLFSGIKTSKWWPFTRIAKSHRRRLKRADALIENIAKVLKLDLPAHGISSARLSDSSFQCNSREELVALIPKIAEAFNKHGMRPGGWVSPEITKKLQKHGLTIVANTFYSVVPDLNELTDEDWKAQKFAVAWDTVNFESMDTFLSNIENHVDELADIPTLCADKAGKFYWDNPMFSPLDAVAYYSLIRSVTPRLIVEVGSGYSTAIAMKALGEASSRTLTCVEPYPSPFLLKQQSKLNGLIKKKIQDVDFEIFEKLKEGDVLFIDSSHCSRLGSDLNFLMFEVLPRLKRGVLIHFHDIFLPSEYPRAWLEDIGIMWNEQYMVLAMLMLNSSFEVLWSSSLAGSTKRQEIERLFEGVLPAGTEFINNLGPYSGGSLWLRKVG